MSGMSLAEMKEALNLEGKFTKGVPADPTVNMTEEQKAEWDKMNETHGDKFKTAYDEAEATEVLESLAGVQGAFRMLRIWKSVQNLGTRYDQMMDPDRYDPVRNFILKARRDGFKDDAIRHYVEEIQGESLPRDWKRLKRLSTDLTAGWEKHFKRGEYLYKFFSEKRVPHKVFHKKDSTGLEHDIPNEVVIEHIAQTRGREREQIENIIRKIDFANGDINHFLDHLAGAIAEGYDGAMRMASGAVNARYLASIPAPKKAEILKAVAQHYGVSVREMESELIDPDAEELYEYLAFDRSLAMSVYREFQRGRFASADTPERIRSMGVALKKMKAKPSSRELVNIQTLGSDVEHDNMASKAQRAQANKIIEEAVALAKQHKLGSETDETAKFEEGEPADPTENMSETDAKKWRLENLKHKDEFKSAAHEYGASTTEKLSYGFNIVVAQAAGRRARLTWKLKQRTASVVQEDAVEVPVVEGHSGLYGYRKATQTACETSVRKLQRRATKLASDLWAEEGQGAVDFLTTHKARTKSRTARVLLGAMKGLGPRLAAEKTAGWKVTVRHGPSSRDYNQVEDLAEDFGGTVIDSGDDGRGDYSEVVFDDQDSSEDFVSKANQKWDTSKSFRRAAEKEARFLSDQQFESKYGVHPGTQFKDQHGIWVVDNEDTKIPGMVQIYLLKRGKAHAKVVAVAELNSKLFQKRAGAKAREHGLYGFSARTAERCVNACSSLRQASGSVASSLHKRRADHHDRITGFLSAHCKQGRCDYSKLLLDAYPAADRRLASLNTPKSVEEWLKLSL